MPGPLDALQTLYSDPMQSDASQNPAIKLAALRKSRLDEMERNRALAGLGGPAPFTTGATDFDVKDLSGDISKDPSTGDVAQQQTSDVNAVNLKAVLAGYPDARTAATAGRAIDFAKSQIPLQQTQATQAGETARSQAQIASQQAIEKMKEDAATKRAVDFMSAIRSMPSDAASNTEIDLPGGGKLRRSAIPTPSGEVGKEVARTLAERVRMETEGPFSLTGYLATGTLDQRKAAAESVLDDKDPGWRQRVVAGNPNFKFATGMRQGITPVGQADPGTERARAALKAHGLPDTPTNIAIAKRQLGIQ